MEYQALNTHGSPLGAVREVIRRVWEEADLDGMVLTTSGDASRPSRPRYILDINLVETVNPFTPLMEINTAKLIPGILAHSPNAKIGALLRPCEIRALIEMTKHTTINLDNFLVISVDCLGTLPADEYQWRLERLEKSHEGHGVLPGGEYPDLAGEALAFARQGGIIPYRYRSACQVCSSPAANHANINIHILGLPVRQQILIMIDNAGMGTKFHFEKLSTVLADRSLVDQHERTVAKMNERHNRTMERLDASLGDQFPTDVDAVIRQLESCKECQACIEVCPICSVDRPTRDADGHFDRASVLRWLVSCAGCGMCEQACPSHLPTSAMFAHIRRELARDWDYLPGRSMDDPLPLVS